MVLSTYQALAQGDIDLFTSTMRERFISFKNLNKNNVSFNENVYKLYSYSKVEQMFEYRFDSSLNYLSGYEYRPEYTTLGDWKGWKRINKISEESFYNNQMALTENLR